MSDSRTGLTMRSSLGWRCATLILLLSQVDVGHAAAQHSIARLWNEALLEAIRVDFARPTVHARNLFHTSIITYDAWAAYDRTADTYLLGKEIDGFRCSFNGIAEPVDLMAAREEAISYAAYRLLTHRFEFSPGADESLARFDSLFAELGFDASYSSEDYSNGSAAALGNYIARCVMDFGMQDGANERDDYVNQYYRPVNEPLAPVLPGNTGIGDPNRWQPIALEIFIDQSGHVIPRKSPDFLGAEWGRVTPFALTPADLTIYERDGREFRVYYDPGPPGYVDPLDVESGADYSWGFALVAIWSSHLDPDDGVMIDISPATFGNIDIADFPRTLGGLRDFYDLLAGGDPSGGRRVNPHTGEPYEAQLVPRGDYTRVLAEFWADGPDSETPPGHWFTILNYVSDDPEFSRRFRGQGPVLDPLEWDVKAYFALGGAVHDAAVAAWGIKGWYDYVRPVSAIRYMADRGQSSDPDLPRYAADGIPLIPGFIEVVESGDPLAGASDENVGEIKLYAWRGPDFIKDPEASVAGVGWILAANWWPYQRPSFVTPPFAGYISGHSTFSRAAAEVMTLLTGDEYFPGGLGEFYAPKDEFLVFEDGPSVDVTLQWATYRDASDQTSLSRIWGGIHPPVDDIPGRLIGEKIGVRAFGLAEELFSGQTSTHVERSSSARSATSVTVYPSPLSRGDLLTVGLDGRTDGLVLKVYNLLGQVEYRADLGGLQVLRMDTDRLSSGVYFVQVSDSYGELASRPIVILR